MGANRERAAWDACGVEADARSEAGVRGCAADGTRGAGGQARGAGGLTRLDEGVYRVTSPAAMRDLGTSLGRVLQAGDAVVLTGDLGAGKTCLTGGVAAGLGDGSAVTSPTFTIMAVHDEGRIPLYHFDLYRLEGSDQLDDVGIYDVLDADGACLVEWGEAYVDELGDERLDVTITREAPMAGNPGGDAAFAEPARVVRATPHGKRAATLLSAWDDDVQRLLAR